MLRERSLGVREYKPNRGMPGEYERSNKEFDDNTVNIKGVQGNTDGIISE